MLADGLRSLLMQTSTVTNIIGTPASRAALRSDGRPAGSGVWWVQMPEEALLPGIVLSQVAGAGIPTMDGPDALHTARIQVGCYGETFADAKGLARAVRAALEGYAGTLPDGTFVGQTILLSEADTFEDAPNSFGCPVDFEFWYSES